MSKKSKNRSDVMPSVGVDEVLDFMDDLFVSGKVVGAVYGFNDDGNEFCIDLETGDVEITHEDGSVEKISGDDPRAKAIFDKEGL